MRLLEKQTESMIRMDQLSPSGCEYAFCSFDGSFIRMPGGVLRETLCLEEFKANVTHMGGYEMYDTGKIVYEMG